MKVLWLHNHYQVWGGESAAAEREANLLQQQPGVTVVREAVHNDQIREMSWLAKAGLPLRNAWSVESYRRVRKLCQEHRPDVLHAHNVWPLLSPAVFAAARREDVATVFTAHNFYLFCLNGVFFRDGRICTDCKGGMPWAGLLHRCYRGLAGSATRFLGTGLHRVLRSFQRLDRILVPTEFARQQFLDAGFAPERVTAKWLSCEDPGYAQPREADDAPAQFLVACRLVEEKGVHILLRACAAARQSWHLMVAGDGPERARLAAMAHDLGGRVTFLGQLTPAALRERMASATAVLLPSIWYETFGLTAIEAFACGRPVVASGIGALQEVVDDQSGLRVAAGDVQAWADAIDRLATDRSLVHRLGQGARARYLAHFTPEHDAARLLAAYRAICP